VKIHSVFLLSAVCSHEEIFRDFEQIPDTLVVDEMTEPRGSENSSEGEEIIAT